jgi:transposase-like protein
MSDLSVDEKMKVVILGFDPKANLAGICKKFGITMAQYRDWRDVFLEGARLALSRPPRSRDTSEIRRDLEKTRVQLRKFLEPGAGPGAPEA